MYLLLFDFIKIKIVQDPELKIIAIKTKFIHQFLTTIQMVSEILTDIFLLYAIDIQYRCQ